jgi:hypothetical protein
VYDVTRQEDDMDHLQLFQKLDNNGDVPAKMIIRRKGKIWISDCVDYQELVNSPTAELTQFGPGEEK